MEEVANVGKKYVVAWLYGIAMLVWAMIALGGLTRLTHSGLSMVEWNLIMGAVPPINEADWQEVFEKYRQYPEYQKINRGMSLESFKFIFWMEYAHRNLGRLIGLVFLLPFVFFLWKRWLKPRMFAKCLLLFALGGLQGLIGWYMVKSGLVDMPRVSQYRLVLHLSAAILVFSLCLWYAFDIQFSRERPAKTEVSLKWPARWIFLLLGAQILSGGFMAGLKAGFAFNTFPKMNESWIPGAMWSLRPWHANLFENPVTVQFIHRWLAIVVTAVVLFVFFRFYKMLAAPRIQRALLLLAVGVVIQAALGIVTLLLRVPVSLASLHQLVAVALWMLVLFLCHQTRTELAALPRAS